MENTEKRQQNKSISQIIEIIGSVVLLICLFLPWVTLQIGGRSTFGMSFDTSYSAFDAINLITKMNNSSSYLPSAVGGGIAQFVVFLYIILALYIINPIVQYNKRVPWLSFYTAWVPVTAGILLLFKTTQGGSGGFGGFGIGVGAVLSLLAGLLMQFSSWTTIGMYHKKYRKYFLTALIWCIAGWVCTIGGYVIALSDSLSFLNSLFDNIVSLFLFLLIWFLATIGIGHTFWLVYGGIVMLFSSTDSSTIPGTERYPAQMKADEFLNQVRTRTDEELKNILQHKEDYNERLVRAAKMIILERVSAPVSSPADSERGKHPVTEVSEVLAIPPVATEDDKYKAYQPRAGSAESEKDKAQTPVRPYNDYDMPKESSEIDEREAQGLARNTSTERVTAPAVRPLRNNLTVLISILVGVLLAVGGALGYFLWYAPYVKDRDAQRTYVVADNVFLRSSRITGVEYNILGKVPYGTEVITYHKLGEWAEVKVGKQEGVIAAAYLLAPSDFALLNGVWGDNDAKECVESSKCRLAILDYLKNNYLQSGPGAWQLYTRPVNQKPNMVFYPRIYDKYSKYTDFVFIIGDHATGNRVLVCYSFDDATEKPIFRFSAGAPASGFIKNMVPKYGGVRVVFDNNEYLDISL